MTEYCANDPCCTEATDFVLHPNGRMTPLCYTCRNAYEWGTASSDVEYYSIDDWDEHKKDSPYYKKEIKNE